MTVIEYNYRICETSRFPNLANLAVWLVYSSVIE